jgi:hypothetical protein
MLLFLNQDIGGWNTSNITTMHYMFENAQAFNQYIGNWNVGKVTNFNSMFNAAKSFNQNLGNWDMQSATNLGSMLNGSNLDCVNYSYTLIGWNSQPDLADNLSLGSHGLQYGTNAILALNNLLNNKGWSFFGHSFSGSNCSPPGVVADDQLIPSGNLQNGDSFCYDANQTIAINNFTVANGASAVFIAGQSITFGPGVVVHPGGYLHASITLTQEFCNVASMLASSDLSTDASTFSSKKLRENYINDFLNIYPNPTPGLFALELSDIDAKSLITVEIISMIRSRIMSQQLPASQHYQFDLSSQQPGIYLIRLMMDGEVKVGKILKQ